MLYVTLSTQLVILFCYRALVFDKIILIIEVIVKKKMMLNISIEKLLNGCFMGSEISRIHRILVKNVNKFCSFCCHIDEREIRFPVDLRMIEVSNE